MKNKQNGWTRRAALKAVGIGTAALAVGAATAQPRRASAFLDFIRANVPKEGIPTIAVCGQVGTGKSNIIKMLAREVFNGGCVIDTVGEGEGWIADGTSLFVVSFDPSHPDMLGVARASGVIREMSRLRGLIRTGGWPERIVSPIFVQHPTGRELCRGTDGIPLSITQHADVTLYTARSETDFFVTVKANRFGNQGITFNVTDHARV